MAKIKQNPGNGGVFPPLEHRFSKDNQPSPQAKSEGRLRWSSRKRLIDDMYTELIGKVHFTNGNEMPALQAMIKKLQNFLLGSKSENLTAKQADILLKVLDLLIPKENKMDLKVENTTISQADLMAIMTERINNAKRKRNAPRNPK